MVFSEKFPVNLMEVIPSKHTLIGNIQCLHVSNKMGRLGMT